MEIKIDRKSYKPIKYQIKEHLKKAIEEGKLKEGEILPSVKTLCKKLKVNYKPIRSALLELKEEGLVYSKKGSGWFVKGVKASLPEKKDDILERFLNSPYVYFPKKKTIVLNLFDSHPVQCKMWEEVFDVYMKDNKDIEIKISHSEEKWDLSQMSYEEIIENENKYVKLNIKDFPNLNFSDTFEVFFLPVIKGDNLLGIPSYLSYPLIFFNNNFSKYFDLKNLTWHKYFKQTIKFSRNYKKRPILSFVSPLIYFLINGVVPFEVEDKKIILNFENEKAKDILKQLEMMGREKCYCEREKERKEEFFQNKIPFMESFIFYKYFLKDEGIDYKMMNFPVKKEGKIPVHCSYWVISKNSGNKGICKEVLNFLISDHAQKIIAKHNHLPLLKSIAYSGYFSPPKIENKKVHLLTVEKGITFDNHYPYFQRFMKEIFNFQMDRLLNQKETYQSILEKIRKETMKFNKGEI